MMTDENHACPPPLQKMADQCVRRSARPNRDELDVDIDLDLIWRFRGLGTTREVSTATI